MRGLKSTPAKLWGVVLILAGLAGVSWSLIPRADAVPSVPIAQLGLATDHAERAAVIASSMPKFQLIGAAAADDNTKKNVRLWDAVLQLRGDHFPNVPQEIGDCVSWGAANAVNYLQAVQLVRGPPMAEEFHPAYPPWIYGASRVWVGAKHGSHFRGDGSVGAYAAEALNEYGCLRSDYEQVPPYSGSIAREWGAKGPPEWAKEVAKPYLVQTVSQVKSAAEARDSIAGAQCPVTIASGWWGTNDIPVVNGRRVAKRTMSWGHQQCLIAYDGSQPGEPLFYCINSWGPNAHPAPMQGEPPGGYWIRFSDVDRICKEGDSWAFSAFEGFPAQGPNWDDLLRRPITSSASPSPDVGGGTMFSSEVGLGLCVLSVLIGLIILRRGKARWFGVVALVCLSVSGCEAQDFDAAARRTVTQSDGISWQAAMQRPVEALSWEMAEQRTIVAANQKKVRAIMYSPSWCSVCLSNHWLLSDGDSRVQYERVKGDPKTGDEAAFPSDIQGMGQNGWPVWSVECSDGVYRLTHAAKSYDDLAAFSKANGVYAKLPASTYWSAIRSRMPVVNSTATAEAPPRNR